MTAVRFLRGSFETMTTKVRPAGRAIGADARLRLRRIEARARIDHPRRQMRELRQQVPEAVHAVVRDERQFVGLMQAGEEAGQEQRASRRRSA